MSKKIIHNVETNEIIEQDMTQAELDDLSNVNQEALAFAQAEAEAQAKKATAEAKLVALGLDLDDLRALGL